MILWKIKKNVCKILIIIYLYQKYLLIKQIDDEGFDES